MAAGYDRKVYISKALEIDDSDAQISFYEHAATLSIGSISRVPKKTDEIWLDFVNIMYVAPVPAETKRGKKFEKYMLENMMEKISVFILCCTRYSMCPSFICKTITSVETETYIMQ